MKICELKTSWQIGAARMNTQFAKSSRQNGGRSRSSGDRSRSCRSSRVAIHRWIPILIIFLRSKIDFQTVIFRRHRPELLTPES